MPLVMGLCRTFRWQTVVSSLALLLGTVFQSDAQGSLDIYADSLLNGFEDWSYAPHGVTNTSPVHSGTYSISVNADFWQAISFHHADFNSTPYKSFAFWVNGGEGGQSLALYAYLDDVYQQYYQVPGVLPANTWQQIVVPLSALGAADKPNLSRFDIKLAQVGSSTSSVFYVDDVQLIAKGLQVDTTLPARLADSRWFGVNTAIWEYGFDSPDTLSLLTEMGCRTLRFPGGSFSDEYHWASNYIVGSSFQGWPTTFGNFMDIATTWGQTCSSLRIMALARPLKRLTGFVGRILPTSAASSIGRSVTSVTGRGKWIATRRLRSWLTILGPMRRGSGIIMRP